MAQIEQSDKGKKKKGAQKKKSIHVDFTPMVDMNMLLITFFMLCTTMIKPQTLNIALPSNEKNPDQTQGTKADEREALTLILDSERDENGHVIMYTDPETGKTYPKHVIYYYQGKALALYNEKSNGRLGEKYGEYTIDMVDKDANGQFDDDELANLFANKVRVENFRGNTRSDAGAIQYNGIRSILHQRNDSILAQIDVLKEKYKNGGYSSDKEENKRLFEEEAAQVRGAKKDTLEGKYDYSYLNPPTIIIKPGPNASFENVISALDEMQINQLGRYQINTIDAVDSLLINNYKKAHPSK